MAQLGRTDPMMTVGIYAHVMLDGDGEREALRALVGADEWAETGRIPAAVGHERAEVQPVEAAQTGQ